MIARQQKSEVYHFIGIGGIGMSAIAEMLVNLGFKVSGSDMKKSYLTDKLEELGVTVFEGHREENVAGASFVVYSSAITGDNPEYAFAQLHKLPLVRRAEMLAELMKLKRGIAIGGTHGKTTTTSILATLLNSRDLGVSYIIGGVVKNLGGHSYLGDGEYLVAEADESDGSFTELSPEFSLVTNIDDDHMNYYQTRRNLEDNFLKFINKIPFYGFCVLNGDDPSIVELLVGVRRRYFTFGIDNPEVDFRISHILMKEQKSEFTLSDGDKHYQFSMNITGRHNIYNAAGALTVALKLGYSPEELTESLLEFKGVGRRLECLFESDKIVVYDDYAHHPTEIRAVIDSQKFHKRKLIVLFQPHRYTRTQEKWKDFVECFHGADKVILLPIYSANEPPIDGVNSVNLTSEINNIGLNAKYLARISLLKQEIDFENDEFILLSLGAGSISRELRIFLRDFES